MNVPPLPTGCPWSDWTPPTIKWNEENLCGWITTPANTWSNGAYLLLALWIWRDSRRFTHPALRAFGPALFFLGLASFAYHASYTWFFQFFDFLGMYGVIFLILTIGVERWGVLRPSTRGPFYLGSILIFSGLTPLVRALGRPIQPIIMVLATAILALEWHLWRRGSPSATDYPILLRAIGYLLAAATFTALDLAGALFSPENHWCQGHALWHIFTALGLHSTYLFCRQFDTLSAQAVDGNGARLLSQEE